MSLADRLAASANQYHLGSECQTCRFIESLAPEDRDAINDWAASGRNMAELWRECVTEGLAVTARNFTAHFEKRHGSR